MWCIMEIHVVKEGESVYEIAGLYGVTPYSIINNNQLANPSLLVPGQTLVILEPGEPAGEGPLGPLRVNGYAYTFADPGILRKALPYLSSLTIFGYGFTMEGDLIPADDEELLRLSGAYGVTPILLISSITETGNFSSEKASYLFRNPWLQTILLTNLISVMQEKGYSGLDIDFEFVNAEDKEFFIGFIERAVTMLHPYGFTVHVDLAPKTSANQSGLLYEAHDYRRIGALADTVLLMTYEWGYTFGPPMAVAPIDKVRQVVEYGVSEIDPRKIYMGIPNYGYDWPLPYIRGVTEARSVGNVEAVDIAARYGAGIQFDEKAKSPYFTYYDEDRIEYIVWFEDAKSIEAKLMLIHEFGLLGAGYWNLMRPFPQNWLVLDSLFTIVK